MANERAGGPRVALMVLALAVWLLPANASAYIDPGTGSLVVQALVAALVTAGFLARSFWGRLTGVFRRRTPGAKAAEDRPSPKGPS